MNSTDLNDQYEAKVKEFMQLLNNQQTLENEWNEFDRDLIEFDGEIKKHKKEIAILIDKKADIDRVMANLKIPASQSRYLVRQCRNELDLLKSAFFQKRSEGL